ncbi:hypothetical protein [Kitasatospora sp. NPDC047058]|uniref:hypothetical protein n=1 Tax=Kitasatospora sp. NPDC047058 TaxID=3155620 RepID=UPI0033C697A3
MSTTTPRMGLYKTASDGSELVNVVTDLLNNLDKLDLNANFRDCTSSTRPSTVWAGLCIRESDTGRLWVSNGSAPASGSWKQLPVEGATFLAGLVLGSTLAVAGAVTFNSTLAVTGAATLSSTLGVAGAVNLNSTLAVTGASTLTGNVTVGGTISSLTSSMAEDTTTRTTTSTSMATVAGALTGTLTVPPSGRVKVTVYTLQRNSSSNNTFTSFRAVGSSSGTNYTETLSGALVVTGGSNAPGTMVRRLTGLTPGETLTVTPYHMVNAGTGTYDYRQILIEALGA